MKNQALFSSKDESKKLKFCLLQFLFGTLRVNSIPLISVTRDHESRFLVPYCSVVACKSSFFPSIPVVKLA